MVRFPCPFSQRGQFLAPATKRRVGIDRSVRMHVLSSSNIERISFGGATRKILNALGKSGTVSNLISPDLDQCAAAGLFGDCKMSAPSGPRARPLHTGGVPCVWNDSIVFSPQAWPFLRSSSVHTIGFQSGARMRRAPALATSTRLPPGS
jgi:hypothetical protein